MPSDKEKENTIVFLTCWCVSERGRVVAQLLPLLSSAVNPDAEAHEDDPAGPANACDESRLLDHVGDLLGQTHAAFLGAAARAICVAWHGRLLGWRLCDREEEIEREMKGIFLCRKATKANK